MKKGEQSVDAVREGTSLDSSLPPDEDEVKAQKEDKPKDAQAEPAPEEPIESLKAKVQSYWDQILRLQADFVNYRKRAEKEKQEAIQFGRQIILEKMIALTDVMESALCHAQNSTDANSLKKGFELVVNEFVSFLKSQGAEPLKTVGEKFNPHLHEAIVQIATEKKEEDQLIVEEMQKGYLLNGRLLRPAKVKVAKFISKSDDKDNQKI